MSLEAPDAALSVLGATRELLAPVPLLLVSFRPLEYKFVEGDGEEVSSYLFSRTCTNGCSSASWNTCVLSSSSFRPATVYLCESLSLSFFESHYFLSRSRLQLCQENYTIDVSLLRALRALQSAKAALLPHISAIISTTATHTFCSSGTDTDTIVSQTTYLSCVRAVHSLLAAAFRRCSLCFHPYALMHHTHIYNRRVLRSSIAP